jgi:uncharacterized protein (TIGR02452 family)
MFWVLYHLIIKLPEYRFSSRDASRSNQIMSLKNTAQETLNILEAGKYINKAGQTIEFLAAQQMAVKKTVLYTPQQSSQLLATAGSGTSDRQPQIEVTSETTQAAAHRLVKAEGCKDLVLLSFASARNPGGGFTNGAKAQEEDLARCSGIYPCLLTQPTYFAVYTSNRNLDTLTAFQTRFRS